MAERVERVEYVQTIHRSDSNTPDVNVWPSKEAAERAYYAKRGILPKGTITRRELRRQVWVLVTDEPVEAQP